MTDEPLSNFRYALKMAKIRDRNRGRVWDPCYKRWGFVWKDFTRDHRDMPYLRAVAIGLALIFFFFIAAPLQWAAMRLRPDLARRVPLAFGRTLSFLLQVEVATDGLSRASDGPRLLVANHVSWIDILVLCSIEPISFLAKQEIASWPVVSSFAKLQQTVFIDRKRRRAIPGANAAMAQRMLQGRSVLLFPEGTTGDGKALLKFHSSHFAAARDLLADTEEVETVLVQPIAIRYSSPSAAWTGNALLLPHIWAILKGAPMRCDVAFGAPLPYARQTNRKIIAQEAKAAIVDMLVALAPAGEAVNPLELEAATQPILPWAKSA